jgi:hypothetical protein
MKYRWRLFVCSQGDRRFTPNENAPDQKRFQRYKSAGQPGPFISKCSIPLCLFPDPKPSFFRLPRSQSKAGRIGHQTRRRMQRNTPIPAIGRTGIGTGRTVSGTSYRHRPHKKPMLQQEFNGLCSRRFDIPQIPPRSRNRRIARSPPGRRRSYGVARFPNGYPS